MPVHRGETTRNGERVCYYQWGSSGKKYTYECGNEAARKMAKRRAQEQGRAARASGYES